MVNTSVIHWKKKKHYTLRQIGRSRFIHMRGALSGDDEIAEIYVKQGAPLAVTGNWASSSVHGTLSIADLSFADHQN